MLEKITGVNPKNIDPELYRKVGEQDLTLPLGILGATRRVLITIQRAVRREFQEEGIRRQKFEILRIEHETENLGR